MTRDRTELKPQGHSPDPGSSRASHQSLPVRWRIVWDRGTTQEQNEKFHSSLREKPVFSRTLGTKELRALSRRGRASAPSDTVPLHLELPPGQTDAPLTHSSPQLTLKLRSWSQSKALTENALSG